MSPFDLITCSEDDLVFGVPASSEWRVNFLLLQVVRSLISITLPRCLRVCVVFFCLPLLVSNFSAHPTCVTLGPSASTAAAKNNAQPLLGGCLAGQRLPPCRVLFARRNAFTAVS